MQSLRGDQFYKIIPLWVRYADVRKSCTMLTPHAGTYQKLSPVLIHTRIVKNRYFSFLSSRQEIDSPLARAFAISSWFWSQSRQKVSENDPGEALA